MIYYQNQMSMNADIQINQQFGIFYNVRPISLEACFKLYIDRLILKDCKILW